VTVRKRPLGIQPKIPSFVPADVRCGGHVLPTEYSLWSRDPEDEILPAVREPGIGFVPF